MLRVHQEVCAGMLVAAASVITKPARYSRAIYRKGDKSWTIPTVNEAGAKNEI